VEWEQALKNYGHALLVSAYRQTIDGLEYHDVVSEMRLCLWQACKTWDQEKGPFGRYWWSVWMNKKADLIRGNLRQKRPKVIPTGDWMPESSYTMQRVPEPPQGGTALTNLIWSMLACGETASDVITLLPISRRSFYRIISEWRNDHVKERLRESVDA
jgi:DNA-directed RNA polymerase specialized sigma24 family protein